VRAIVDGVIPSIVGVECTLADGRISLVESVGDIGA